MPAQLPKRCRFDDERDGVAFEVDFNGRMMKCFISTEALEDHFAPCESKYAKVALVRDNSSIARKALELAANGDGEPITLVTRMF